MCLIYNTAIYYGVFVICFISYLSMCTLAILHNTCGNVSGFLKPKPFCQANHAVDNSISY